MKNDGFTLVELIAVIAILGLLALVVTVSVNTTLTNSEKKLNAVQIEKIKDAAKIYYLNEGKTCVNVSYLIENDYIEKMNIKNSEENGTLGSVKITYNSKKYIYEYQENECPYMDSVCNIVSGEEKQIGSKYACKVRDDMETGFEDGYYFYVLSYNDNEGNLTDDITEAKSLNLIMDRNINSDGTPVTEAITYEQYETEEKEVYNIVAWLNQDDYETAGGEKWDDWEDNNNYGPITAMQFLYNATKDWVNIPPLNYEYKDEEWQESVGVELYGGYESFVSEKGVGKINDEKFTEEEPLRARMPIYAYSDNGEHGEVSDKKDDDSNSYLYENGIDDINGYWTLSSYAHYYEEAWFVSCVGHVYDDFVGFEDRRGVRPVITLEI